MSNAIFKYQYGGETFYLTLSDAGCHSKFIEQRNSLDVELTPEQIIVHIVHKLTAAEMSARVIKNQRKVIDDALAIINDEATKVEHGL